MPCNPRAPPSPASYYGRVLPSAGLIPVLESLFCGDSGEPDGFGFKRYPNSS